jgi:ubiquinone biosynthesis accessory factor UbiJ
MQSASSSAPIIKPIIISVLESALNHYLALDEDAGLFLEPLAGKVIAVNVQPFNWTFFICPTAEKIQILESYWGQPDTTLTGSLAALGMMGLSSKPMRSIFSGEVTITGNMQTGRKFQELFDKLDIDLEEKVSQYTGDIIAHKLGQLLRSKADWGKNAVETFKLNVTEYLQEESRDLPSQPEADIFYRNVDKLRADYDRLQVRMERLKKALQDQATLKENE